MNNKITKHGYTRSETIKRLAADIPELENEDLYTSFDTQTFTIEEKGRLIPVTRIFNIKYASSTDMLPNDVLVRNFFSTLGESQDLQVFKAKQIAERKYNHLERNEDIRMIAEDCMTRLAFIQKGDVRREFCLQEAARQIHKLFEGETRRGALAENKESKKKGESRTS